MIDVGRDYGYTDAKIRAAIAAAKAQTTTLFFSASVYTYAYTSTLTLDGVKATGEPGAVLAAANKASMAVILKGQAPELKGVKITCPTAQLPSGPPTSARLSTGESAAVFIQPGCTDWLLDGVQIDRAGSAGILNWGGHNGKILRCDVRNTLADGIHNTNQAYNVEVAYNRCTNVGDDMFAVVSYERDGGPCHDIFVHDNVGDGQPWGRGATVVGGYSIRILGNRIENSYGAGILIATEPAYDSLGVLDVEVSDNTIVNPDTSGMHGCSILISGLRPGYRVDTVYGAYNNCDPSKPAIRTEGDTRNITVEAGPPAGGGTPPMAVEHVFAPKNKPLGNLPANKPGTTVFPDASWSQFLRGEMPQTVGRNRIVDDGGHVWECELRDSDTPHRNEAWRGDNAEQGVYFPGQTMSCCFGFKLADDWSAPPAWCVLWQIHTPYDYPTRAPSYASPMTLISADGGKLHVQNNSEGGVDYTAEYQRGRWHYWIFEIKFGRFDTPPNIGHMRVWHDVDRLPLLSETPVVNKDRNTAMPNHSTATGEYTKSGIYMQPSTGKTYVIRRDGYAEAGSAVRARELYTAICRSSALGSAPPPPPDSLPLTILDNTNSSWVLVGWQPVAGCVGYRSRRDGGKWASTWDPLFRRDTNYPACNTRFAKPYTKLEVEALMPGPKGDLP